MESVENFVSVMKSVGHTSLEIKLENIFEPLLLWSYGSGSEIVDLQLSHYTVF